VPADPNWTKWIRSSLGDYLLSVATENNVPVIIEELHDRDTGFMQSPLRCEVRINGPFTQELSRGYYRVYVDANVLVTSRKDVKQGYAHLAILGQLHSAMDMAIPIFKHGLEAGDDSNVELGCLTPRPGKSDAIKVLSFGQVEKTDQIVQNAVDARYVMFLTVNE
jgi:hypothetical protein